jgi:hypothetical protein
MVRVFNSILEVQGSYFTNDFVAVSDGNWLNVPYLIGLPMLSAYLGRLGGLLSHLYYFKFSLSGDMCQQLMGWK